jgi:hypothetical protein
MMIMNRTFELHRTVELNATPDQIWQAVATGAGQQAWMFPTGGETPSAVGETIMGHRVEAFDPPHHFRVHLDGEDGFFNTLEYLIEGRDGSTTVMRYLHSGVITEDWDHQYDAVDQHTDFYLHTLGQYLSHFAGRPAAYVGTEGPQDSNAPGAFEALQRQLGVDGAEEGDVVTLQVPGLAPIEGVVDYRREAFLGIRSGDALYRFFGRNVFGMPIGIGHHLFAEGVDQEAEQQAWASWLSGVFAVV